MPVRECVVGRDDGSAYTVRAKPLPGQWLSVLFESPHDTGLRATRTLGNGRVVLERWAVEDDRDRFLWAPYNEEPTGDALLLVTLATSLTEDEVLALCRQFAEGYRDIRGDGVTLAEDKRVAVKRELRWARRAEQNAQVREAALAIEDPGLREIALRLAPSWRGDPDGLRAAAEEIDT